MTARGNSRTNARAGLPPAFLLYVADWLTSQTVRCMTHAERGAYIDLLCYAWRDGSIPADLDRIARLVGVDPITLAEWWVTIGPCWVVDEARPDRLINERQEHERRQLISYKAERSRAGLAGAEARWRPAEVSPSDSSPIEQPLANDGIASATATTKKRRGAAKEILERLNDVRERIGLRRLQPTDGNIKPIAARLADYDADALLSAWAGASRDEWVVENNKLLPSHVFRPANIEGYMDAGTQKAKPVIDPHSQRPVIANEWECAVCRKVTIHYTQEQAQDKPPGYKCGSCKEKESWAAEVSERGERPKAISDIMDALKRDYTPDRLSDDSVSDTMV